MSSVRAPDYDRGIEEPEMPFDFDRYRRPEVYGPDRLFVRLRATASAEISSASTLVH